HLLTSNKLDKDSKFSAEFRNLFQKAFPYFTEEQRLDTLNKIQNFVVKDEAYMWKFGDQPKFYSYWGRAKYLLLKRLPEEVIVGTDSVKRQFQELDRKHKGYKELNGPRSILAGAVRNPIDSESCARMNAKQWLRSFRKYTDDHDRSGDDYLKGGLREHSSAFKESVKNDPSNEKLSIIETVLYDKTINQSYATQGVLGWIEGNGSAAKILPFFKEILKRHVPGESHYEKERIANYLIRAKEVDKDILDYVVSLALNFKIEDETIYLSDVEDGKETSIISGLVTRAINTSYGSAAEGLLYVTDSKTSDLVFETLESILKNGPRESRAVIFFRFAYLMNLDREKAFNLFVKYITSEKDIYVVASSIWSLQYLGDYDFERLLPIYQRLANCNVLGSDDTNWVFLLLYFAYLLERDASGILVKTLLRNSKNACSIAVNEITKHYYEIDKTMEKSNELLHLVLDLADEEIIEEIHWNFSSAENLKIDDLYDFIERYIRTKFFRNNENLLNYLTQQCTNNPEKAILLFETAILNNQASKKNYDLLDRNMSTVKFIVGAFSSLKKNTDLDKKLRLTLLRSFDTVLKNFRYRRTSEKMLDELL
ncbi:MAG: hypothetical protein HYZ42_09055, partial [Bacteroidetes bacterium]|nr:hypothetical protein [Bacteroidota bacterium]